MKTYSSVELAAIAQSVQECVVADRREMHKHPETRYDTKKTRAFIGHQIEVCRVFSEEKAPQVIVREPKYSKGGIVVDIDVVGGTERILFRADFDALNVKEATGLPFTSQVEGKSHACGHDCHTAMLLGFLRCVARGEIVPTRNIRLVFQDAEENPLDESGGAALVREGVLDGVSEAHALHIWATGTAGSFISRPNGMLGSSDRLKVIVKATGGHVAFPDNGSNAIDIATDIQVALREFWKRYDRKEVSLAPAAVIAGSGKASNVRPSEAELWFAIRSYFGQTDRARFHAEARLAIEKVAANYPDAKVEAEIIRGHPALINSPGSYEETRTLLEGAGQVTEDMERMLGGEDFAHYLEGQGGVPGSMWMLGANQPGCGDHHTPTFNPDESVLWRGVLFWLLQATK